MLNGIAELITVPFLALLTAMLVQLLLCRLATERNRPWVSKILPRLVRFGLFYTMADLFVFPWTLPALFPSALSGWPYPHIINYPAAQLFLDPLYGAVCLFFVLLGCTAGRWLTEIPGTETKKQTA